MSVTLFNIKNKDSMTLCSNANKSYTCSHVENIEQASIESRVLFQSFPNGKLERPKFF